MATIVPRDNTNRLQPIQDAINQRNQQQAQLANIVAHAKIKDLMATLDRQRQGTAMESTFPGQGQQLANMPTDVRSQYIKEQLAAPRRQEFGNIMAALSGGQMPSQQNMQQVQPQDIENQQQVQPKQHENMPTKRPGVIDPSSINWAAIPENQQMGVASLIQKANSDAQSIDQRERFHQDDNALKLLSIDQKIKATGDRKLSKIWSDISPRIREANDKAKGSFEQINSLMNMKKMNDSGALNNQSYTTILDLLGLGEYPALLDPTSQNYQEEMNSVIGSWSDLFPRGTQSEFKAFLTTQMPSLIKSQKGRDIIINRFLAANLAKQRYANIWNDTIKKHGENIPFDIEAKVERKALKAGSQLYKNFAQGKMADMPELEGYEPLAKFTPEGNPVEEQKPEQIAQAMPEMAQNNQPPTPPKEFPKMEENVSPYTGIVSKDRTPQEINKELEQYVGNMGKNPIAQDIKATGARVGEGIVGAPGNLQYLGQGALALGSMIPNKLSGGKIPKIPFYNEEFQQKHPYLSAPTPEMLRKLNQIPAGTQAGEYISNLAGNIASAAATGFGMGASAVNAAKGTIGGEIARVGAKSLGFQELGQGIASAAGTLAGSSEMVLPKLFDIATNAYKGHASKLAGLESKTGAYKSFLGNLVNEYAPALKTSGMEKLATKLENATKMPAKLPASFWGNEIQTVNKLYNETPKDQWHILDKIKTFLDKQMSKVAKTSSIAAEGVEDFRLGQRAYAAGSSGLKVRDFAKQHITDPILEGLKDPVKAIFGLGKILSHPKASLGAAGGATLGVLGGVPLYNAIKIMSEHPEFKHLYVKALKDVAANNGKSFMKTVMAMNKIV